MKPFKQRMKKCWQKISGHSITILLSICIVLCVWAIASIQLKCIPLIERDMPIERAEGYNEVFINLSYSFLAGWFFYLLTTKLKYWNSKRKLKPMMRQKMHKIVQSIDDAILEFSRNENTPTKTNREDVETILNSKSWTDTIPMFEQLYGYKGRYIDYISSTGKHVRTMVMELIDIYKEYMTEEQINRLEALVEMRIFSLANNFSPMQKINLDDPNGKKCLVNDFCDMYEELKSIEKTFR